MAIKSEIDTVKNKEKSAFKKATLILIIGLICSKVSGQVREVLYGVMLQDPQLTDAYVQGFLIPDFIYDLLVGGSIQAAIIPALAGAVGTAKEKKVWRDVSIFISFFSLLMFCFICVLEIFAAPVLAFISKEDNLTLTVAVARRLFPQTFFMMGAALAIGILNAHKKFTRTALGPAIYNTLVCACLYFLGKPREQALMQVAWGISFSALLYCLWQIILGFKELKNLRFSLKFGNKGFRRLLFLALPTMFSASVAQLGSIILQAYTKQMPLGSATALRYATTVWMLPYGIFTVAIGQVMLPSLSAYIQQAHYKKAAQMLTQSLRLVLLFALPSALIFFAMREDIMIGIFWWHNYAPTYTVNMPAAAMQSYEVLKLAASILQFYSPAIVFQSIIYIYNFAFYAKKITLIPLLNAVVSLVITVCLGYIAAKTGNVAALSLAYGISSLFIALCLYLLYHAKFRRIRLGGMKYFVWQNFIALFLLSLYLFVDMAVAPYLPYRTKIFSLLIIGIRGALAYTVYYSVIALSGLPEFKQLKRRFFGR